MASITTNSSRTQQQPLAEVLPKNEREKNVPYKNFGELKKKHSWLLFFTMCRKESKKVSHPSSMSLPIEEPGKSRHSHITQKPHGRVIPEER